MAGGNDRLQLVIDLAQAEIAVQFAATVGFDSQAIGILLFDGAIAGTLIALASIHWPPVAGSWGVPLAGLAVSAAFAFSTATLGRLKAGPVLSEFRDKILQLQGETATAESQEAAVNDLLETIRINRGVIRRKEATLGVSLVLLAVTFVGRAVFVGRAAAWTADSCVFGNSDGMDLCKRGVELRLWLHRWQRVTSRASARLVLRSPIRWRPMIRLAINSKRSMLACSYPSP